MKALDRSVKTPRWLALVVAMCAGVVLMPTSIVRTAAVPILEPVQSAGAGRLSVASPSTGATRSRLVNVNLYPLPTPGTSARSREDDLELALFPDVTVRAVFERFDTVGGSGTWVGHVEGWSMGSVSLAYRDGFLNGHVSMPDAIYEIRPVFDGSEPQAGSKPLHVVSEVAPTSLSGTPDMETAPLGDRSLSSSQPAPSADSGDVIDLMVVYTPGAVTYAGGNAGIANLIALGVADTNAAYANSGVGQRVRLVHSEFAPYTGPVSSTIDLTNLRTGAGALTNVPRLREQHGADLVMLVYSHPSDVCGRAYLSTDGRGGDAAFGFSVVNAFCIPNYTFAHELGHNMGALHDWFVEGSDDRMAWPMTFARGHVNPAQRWRTVMAYDNLCQVQGFTCPTINYFSNPDVEWVRFCSGTNFDCDLLRRWFYPRAYVGAPLGGNTSCRAGTVAAVPCETDNRRTLNTTARIVANYRQSR